MENRSRVQEIRQRFESVTSQTSNINVSKPHPLKPPLATKPTHLLNNINEPTAKCVIKRSHAFRSDKSKIKPYITTKDCINNRKPIRQEIKLPSINNNNSSGNQPLTETLKKALKAPLPSGPAPKKPPRTFAHNTDGINKTKDFKMESEDNTKHNEKLTDLDKPNTLNNNNSYNNNSPEKAGQLRSDKLSKEKLLAFIKNFENVIDKKNIENNTHIYDRPNNDTADRSGNSNSGHVYSEPFKSEFSKEDKTKNINSLHYMSTAIENIKIENDDHKLEYLIVPLNKERVEERKEFDTVLRKTRKMLISQNDNDDSEEVYDENTASPLPDYYAMLPPRPPESNAKSHDVFEEIKSLMIEAYNNGSITFNGDGEQAQFRALRGDASSKQLTEMFSQIINESDNRFREKCRSVRRKSSPSEKLIDALLLIGLDTEVDNTRVPYVKAQYKQPSIDIPVKIENLVYPDASNWPPKTSHTFTKHSNCYTIILTKQNGDRSYAYCKRLLPEGSLFCLPLTYVILTGNEDSVFYRKVLDQIEINHGLPENDYKKFVKDLLDLHFPKPGGSLILDDIQITRYEDNGPYDYVISELLNDITVPIFMKLFSSLLFERKIVVVSSHVSKVCDSIEALCKCLYPFSWQHTVISVLPSDMSEMLQCPPPYLVGLLRGKNHLNLQLESLFSNIDNAFVVDVDSHHIIKCVGDENTILPKRLCKSLKSSLYLCPVRAPDSSPSETLLKLFIELVGHYPLVIINGPSGGRDKGGFRVFLRNSFVSALSSKSTEQFLRTFIDTAMFEAFLRERLDNVDFEMGIFEKKCIEFIAEEVRKPSGLLKTITLNRTVKALGDQFLKEE